MKDEHINLIVLMRVYVELWSKALGFEKELEQIDKILYGENVNVIH